MKSKQKTNKTVHGIYKNIEYIAFYNDLDKGRTGIAFYCGYVRLPDDHPYQVFMKIKHWADFGLMLWRNKKREVEEKGWIFTEPKPKSARHYFNNGYEKIPIKVHGGLTFSEIVKKKDIKDTFQKFREGSWIGWDYAHAGDQMYDLEKLKKLNPHIWELEDSFQRKFHSFPHHRWTSKEVIKDCKNVIDQLLKVTKKRVKN